MATASPSDVAPGPGAPGTPSSKDQSTAPGAPLSASATSFNPDGSGGGAGAPQEGGGAPSANGFLWGSIGQSSGSPSQQAQARDDRSGTPGASSSTGGTPAKPNAASSGGGGPDNSLGGLWNFGGFDVDGKRCTNLIFCNCSYLMQIFLQCKFMCSFLFLLTQLFVLLSTIVQP